MDRSSMIGLFLIGLILIGFSIWNAPTEEELAARKREQDSIALVTRQQEANAIRTQPAALAPASDTTALKSVLNTDSLDVDSLQAQRYRDQFGVFADAAKGEDQVYVLENDLARISIGSRGGRIRKVELKKYKTAEGKPVVLFASDSTRFGLNFFSQNRMINTDELYFRPLGKPLAVSGKDSAAFTMRLEAGSPDRYIDFVYTLHGDKYLFGYNVIFNGMKEYVASNAGYVELNWMQRLQKQELDMTAERANSTIYYMFADEEVDYLSETSDESEELKTKVTWVAMKQHFFTQVLISEKAFDKPTRIETLSGTETDSFVKQMKASFTLPFSHSPREEFAMQFYIGPNHYQLLKRSGYKLEQQIPLGWGIFGWVNRFLVIPIFNFLNSFNWSYGIIIFILTIAIKILLLPLTFKAYLSQAKMKVLKPEIEEIQGKFKEEPMKLQQEMMGLYRKAGVNPLGGCLPILLQLPILIAMFRFFPQSIELRQESFLWAKDLSRYDSILDLPFNIPFYGSHVSLFTLLMTVSTLLITKVNSQSTMTNPQMKWMLYLMPIVFLGVFNNYSAGLSYYYFLANMISIGQQYLFKAFVNEDEIHRKIQENKKRPQSQTKSKFQQRLEQMAKERGYKPPRGK
jgi:YidC/Oxa1 family membrane protein insertase